MELTFRAVGVIHTPFDETNDMPIQSARSNFPGEVKVYPEFTGGLEGLCEFSHIYLLYGFHRANQEVSMKVQPFLDDRIHGLFATQYPARPNPIGLSIVRITAVQENVIFFNGQTC